MHTTKHLFCTHRTQRFHRRDSRQGMVLILVLVAVAMLSLAAFTFSDLMSTEHRAAVASLRRVQARTFADSGMDFVQQFIAQEPSVIQQLGGVYNNPGRFQSVLVLDSNLPRDRGRFSIVSANIENGQLQGTRYGVEDDSARINLNVILALDASKPGTGRDLLMKLPAMTESIADAILDWMDDDDEPREFGAESNSYSGQGYSCKNGPLDTLEELLLVEGVTADLLFGADLNRNGTIDASEEGYPRLSGTAGAEPEADRGWAAYLTLYSKERNVRPDGTRRIDLNGADLQVLHDELQAVLDEDLVKYIIAYRQYGPAPTTSRTGSSSSGSGSSGSGSAGSGQGSAAPGGEEEEEKLPSGEGPPSEGQPNQGNSGDQGGGARSTTPTRELSSVELDLKKPAKTNIANILDLVGSKVQVTEGRGASDGAAGGGGSRGGQNQQNGYIVLSPITEEPGAFAQLLPDLLDNVTVNKALAIPGRININQASPIVLRAIPGMTEEMVERILASRETEPTGQMPTHRHEHWLLYEDIVTLAEMKKMVPYICASGAVHRAQVVGYFDDEGPSARIEVVVDASSGVSRIVFWRDISNLGRGYSLETLGAVR
ncbi:MAG: type II secretion system protein GspK [Planctomycetota bacterium]|nr:type II secretion system protein GspK [Planctomycetota bacterium]